MKKHVLIFLIMLIACAAGNSHAAPQKSICMVYFTGVGCPHCAKTDPVLLIDLLKQHPEIIVIEYEIYHEQGNAPLLLKYGENYNSGLGVPLIILSKKNHIIGDFPILNNLDRITELSENPCPMDNGSSIAFEELNIAALPGKPKIWRNGRILIKTTGGGNSMLLRNLLMSQNISSVLEEINYTLVEPVPVELSGRTVYFDNAIELEGWIFQWNGGKANDTFSNQETGTVHPPSPDSSTTPELTLVKLVSLAAVDAVNPCALAVLTFMLIAILTYNPEKKRNVLLAGLAFSASVFVTYLFYGLIIIKFFQIVQALTAVRLLLYKILGVAAIILGLLNIKDWIRHKPGGFATEMPLSFRPKVKKIISGVTSPKGAFFVGIFVTVFLLPCTIGPYIIAGGILSIFKIIEALPFLLLYNLIFISPMIAITLIVYTGFAKVENVSGWRKKNVRKLHLIAGIIMLGLGIGMTLGLV